MPNLNLRLLEEAASKLQALLDDVVFVGGATLGLFITDKGAAPVRATDDVDVIAEITTQMEYFDFSERLRNSGFTEDHREGAPLCRWLHGDLILDVMPLEKSILGFSNVWYPGALEFAQQIELPSRVSIHCVTTTYFLGTKIEAFRGRGNNDFYDSHDLEDFISVIDGRARILDEIASSDVELRIYLAEAASKLIAEPRFMDALPGYLGWDEASQQRLPGLLAKLRTIAGG
jgi:hypothetical protein